MSPTFLMQNCSKLFAWHGHVTLSIIRNGHDTKWMAKNEKRVSKLAKLLSLRPLALNGEFLLEFEFLKNYKELYGKCCWWARSAHQQYFPYKSFKFPKNSSCHKNSLCNVRSLKLCQFYIFDMLFSFLASVLNYDCFWRLTRSRDRVMQRAYSYCITIFTVSFGNPNELLP